MPLPSFHFHRQSFHPSALPARLMLLERCHFWTMCLGWSCPPPLVILLLEGTPSQSPPDGTGASSLTLTPTPFPRPVPRSSVWPLLKSSRFWARVAPYPHCLTHGPHRPSWMRHPGQRFQPCVWYPAQLFAWCWPHPKCLRNVWKLGLLGLSLSQSGVPLSYQHENPLEGAACPQSFWTKILETGFSKA